MNASPKIDGLILKVKNVDELLAKLEMLGYTVRRGKYISVKAPDQQRAVRLITLGEDFTIESLASRILWKDVGSGGTLIEGQPSELSERYSATIYDVEQLALTGRKVQRKRDTSMPYSPQNDMDDRVLTDSKTGKQIALRLMKKVKQRNDPLLEEYERAKNRHYKQVEQYENSEENSDVIRLTFNEYKKWLDRASEVKILYLQGKVSAEQFSAVLQEL